LQLKKWSQHLDGIIATAFVAAFVVNLWIPLQFAMDPMTRFTVVYATADSVEVQSLDFWTDPT